jgi:hypothetical protein
MKTPANAFLGKTEEPTARDLAFALGSAKEAWDRLLADLAQEHGANVLEWKCYSPKTGWALRVTRKKRTIVWLAPCPDSFEVLFILGQKAVQAARQAKLPKRIVKVIDEAPKYPEGTGVRLQVKTAGCLEVLMKLAAIKVAN